MDANSHVNIRLGYRPYGSVQVRKIKKWAFNVKALKGKFQVLIPLSHKRVMDGILEHPRGH